MLKTSKNNLSNCLSVNYLLIRCLFVFAITTTSLHNGLSQLGSPTIFNYKKSDYQAAISNWDIVASNYGLIYAANSAGLLIFDGYQWTNTPLPNNSIVRSVYEYQDKIYVGGQDEVGYFQIDSTGNYQYTSLRAKVPEIHLPLEDIWNIQVLDDIVYFNSKDRIYVINNDGCTVIYTGNPIFGLTSTKDAIYFIDQKDGVYEIGMDSLILSIAKEEIPDGLANLSGSPESLFLTTNGGRIMKKVGDTFLEIKTPLTSFFNQNKIQTIQADNQHICVGTRYGGIAVLSKSGQPLYLLDKQKGLLNNNINALAIDKNGAIWSATANGIDHILASDKKQMLYPDGDLHGSVYDVIQYEGKLYFGTTNGLYVDDPSTSNRHYSLIEGSAGQVWGLDIVEGDLMMAHNNGAYQIKGSKAVKISPGIGAWKFVATPDRMHMYVGTYFGVELYEKTATGWSYVKKYAYPQESSRVLVSGLDNNLWVSHPYRGVYRMIIDENFNLVISAPFYGQKGLPTNQLNYVFKVNGKVVVAAETGVYEYDQMEDRFVESQWLSDHLPKGINIRNIQADKEGNIWYITSEQVAKIDRSTATVKYKYYPELVNRFNGGFETLFLLDKNKMIACSDEGAIQYDISLQHPLNSDSLKARIISLELSDGTLVREQTLLHKSIRLAHDKNTIKAIFSNNLIRADVQYQYFLKGANEGWSDWTTTQEKEFANLPSGSYNLEVRCKTPDGLTSSPVTVPFEVVPPWYRTKLAYTLFGIIALLMIIGLLLIPNKQYQKQKARLQTEKEEKEAELEKMKNEKLVAELEHQNSELASSTLHLVQKNSTLQKVKTDLETLRKSAKDPDLRKQLKKILSSLSDDERLEEEWENFSIHFDKVHANFLKRLKTNHPNLSPKDQKLAAYLRMNLSTKEIAPMLNISVRGVEISRYRLRKKLELEKEKNLSEWMMGF